MRANKHMFDVVSTGKLVGESRVAGRVLVEPDWVLKTTTTTYGNTIRGPYRYFQDSANNQFEVEIPQIKSIQITRSSTQDIATCSITLLSQYHEGNTIVPELGTRLGKPGYFWPKHGESAESNVLWGQTVAKGAKRRDGTWLPDFEWKNVIVPNALLRTAQGYGGHDLSFDDALDQDKIMLTGVWLVDHISSGSDGEIQIECRDVGRLLLEQVVYPPLIPQALYPLEYYPPGLSAFDSPFGAKPVTGVGLVSQAEVRLLYLNSSFGNGSISGHYGSEAADDNVTNFSWSPAVATPVSGPNYHWWGFQPVGGNQVIDTVHFRPWAGGYTAYISVYNGSSWLGSDTVPQVGQGNVPYLKKIQVPYAIPDGYERQLSVQLDSAVTATQVRITLGPTFEYSSVGESGNYYRSGLRTVIASRTGAPVPDYFAPFESVMWTYAMASHPVRGYWVADDVGNIYGFGDAADYDSSTYGPVPLAYSAGIRGQNNIHLLSISAHPSGKGYWTLDNTGVVHAYGAAVHYGQVYVGCHPYNDGIKAVEIASTHTGNGYWVAYSNGVIHGFGDASPSYVVLPYTNVTNFMNAAPLNYIYLYPSGNPLGFDVGWTGPATYDTYFRCTSIVGHPTKMGFWAADGSGQVFPYGDVGFFGELQNRWFNPGMSNTFKIGPYEWTMQIETTQSGNGYWLMFPSGHIAAFGDAVGQGGTSYIYQHNTQMAEVSLPSANQDWSFFRALAWGISRDPDGSGFWVLIADGSVLGYDAQYWGQPGWKNRSGYRWHDGNTKDSSDIVKDLLAWAGFAYYSASLPPGPGGVTARPPINGNIESTGIPTTTVLKGDKWDKRSVIDCINELRQVTAYSTFVDEEGGFHFESPNFWAPGNRSLQGTKLFAKYEEDGSWDFVAEGTPGAEPFIPELHEAIDLINYRASLDGDSLRSEVIIGSDLPDPNDPSRTKSVKFIPPTATDEIRPGVPALRNIVRPAAWVNTNFDNERENRLMAELIALRIWFAQRTGSATIIGNPALSIGSQVRIVERTTSDTFIHLIQSISSSMDLVSGQYTMEISTNWLGDATDWVITSDNVYNPITHASVSEVVDRWQLALNRGLPFHGLGSANPQLRGGFE